MLFIWSGKGYMVPLSAALSTLGMMGATSLLNVEIQDDMSSAAAAMISGIFIWKLHFRLERNAAPMRIVNDETGESEEFRTKHDFYWIPLKYWGVVFAVGGIITAINTAYPGIFA